MSEAGVALGPPQEERFQIVSWFYKGTLAGPPIGNRINPKGNGPSPGRVRLHLLVIRASPIARPQTPGLIV